MEKSPAYPERLHFTQAWAITLSPFLTSFSNFRMVDCAVTTELKFMCGTSAMPPLTGFTCLVSSIKGTRSCMDLMDLGLMFFETEN